MWVWALLACGTPGEPAPPGAKPVGPLKAVDTARATGDTGSPSADDTSGASGDTTLIDTALIDTAGTAATDTADVTATLTGDTSSTTDTASTFDVPDFLAGGWIVFSPDPNTCVSVTDDTLWVSQVTSTGFVADLGAGKVFDCDLQMVDLASEAADFTCHYFLADVDWGAIFETTIDVTASVVAGEGTVLFEVDHEVISLYPLGCTDVVSGYIVKL